MFRVRKLFCTFAVIGLYSFLILLQAYWVVRESSGGFDISETLRNTLVSLERPNLVESTDLHRTIQHSKDGRNVDPVCRTLPGLGIEEKSHMGYQVLRRMNHFMKKSDRGMHRDIRLLCIILDSVSNDARQILGMYSEQCDEAVVLQTKRSNLTTKGSTQCHTIRMDTEKFHVSLQKILSVNFTWFHILDQSRYYFVPEHLKLLLQYNQRSAADTGTTAHLLESWTIDDLDAKKYHELYPNSDKTSKLKCQSYRTGNRRQMEQLAQCHLRNGTRNFFEWLAECSAINTVCAQASLRESRTTPWFYLQRYYEIRLPESVSPLSKQISASHRRLHAILHGDCDALWDQPYPALDENGKAGYIHDPYYLRKHIPDFTFNVPGEKHGVCDLAWGEGPEGRDGYVGLSKIRVMNTSHVTKKLLCMVYTHSGRHSQLRAVAETWGKLCDGFFAASNQTDVSIGAVNLTHEGPEMYRNMWLKVRSMWQYVYDHYLDNFDYFHIGGDDHYLIPSNLVHMMHVGSWKGPFNDSQPLLLGGSLPLNNKRRYCNGGSGYTLNRAAVRMLVEQLFPTPRCWPHWRGSEEDKLISSCFRSVGIQCIDTNDERNETRYHTWTAQQHVDWTVGKPAQKWYLLPRYHGIAWKEGLGQISETSVSFHLKRDPPTNNDSGMRRYHAMLYGLCRTFE